MVVDGLLADGRIGVGEAAELIGVVLERVAVDGAELYTVVLGERSECGVVVHLVPRDVQGDCRGQCGVLVHLGGIRDLLLRRARSTRSSEHLEAGARVAEGPGGQFDGLLLQQRGDLAELHH
jgi:hypothetical protein